MSLSTEARSDVFDVIFVCTGNICRSPMAELILCRRLTDALPAASRHFRVHSAGTYGLHDYPIDPRAAKAITDLGIDPDSFRARELSDSMLSAADIILTATRDHRATTVTMAPRTARRTFTIREFGRLCAGVDPADITDARPAARARQIVLHAGERRGLEPAPYDEDEIVDPYHARQADFATSVRLIQESLDPFVRLLADGVS